MSPKEYTFSSPLSRTTVTDSLSASLSSAQISFAVDASDKADTHSVSDADLEVFFFKELTFQTR